MRSGSISTQPVIRGLQPCVQRRMSKGIDVLHNPFLNKGTAFTMEERQDLGLTGLLPPRIFSIMHQKERALSQFHEKKSDIEKYIYLQALHDRNVRLFYSLLTDNITEMMPIVYTPTIGKACIEFGKMFRRAYGLFISKNERGNIRGVLDNWPEDDIRVIVVTDGERILGLGDLGAHGAGIPIGKLKLYTACAGIDPRKTLPITLDVGTNNQSLLTDPLYVGLQSPRLDGDEYYSFIEEFVVAVKDKYPKVLLQWEDFGNRNAFVLADMYRNRIMSFNDDIQGTAAVSLSGLIAASRLTGDIRDFKILFLGAGEAGTGIATLTSEYLQRLGVSETDAMSKIWFVDSQGLLTKQRGDYNSLPHHKKPWAHSLSPSESSSKTPLGLLDAIKLLKPTALIGVSSQPGSFNKDVLETMASVNSRPIIFALSNPTSKSECTAEDAYRYTNGRGIFASGSPFDPVTYQSRTYVTGQGNNAYIFPAFGLATLATAPSSLPDDLFLEAAESLARQVTVEDLSTGCLYPPLKNIREVTVRIAVDMCRRIFKLKLNHPSIAVPSSSHDIEALVRSNIYNPDY